MLLLFLLLLVVAICQFSNRQKRTGVYLIMLTLVRVLLLLVAATSPASNGQERTGTIGTTVLVLGLLLAVISPASNGQERMDVHGTKNECLLQLIKAAIQMCLTMSFSKGVQMTRLIQQTI